MTPRAFPRIIAPSMLAALALAAALPASAHDSNFDRLPGQLRGSPGALVAGRWQVHGKAQQGRDRGRLETRVRRARLRRPQAHVHFGQRSVNGGIAVFLCTNLGNGPAGTPACPLRSGKISGTFDAADVLGPTGQGIPAGAFDRLLEALREGVAYANVHTTGFAGGEIRGQLK